MNRTLFAALAAIALQATAADDGKDKVFYRGVIRTGVGNNGVAKQEFKEKVLPVNYVTSINYKILLLNPEGKDTTVPNDQAFKIGQQFRLQIETDSDLYLYVFHEGPDGLRTVLVPDAKIGEEAPIAKKGKITLVPGDDSRFEFVAPPGVEKLTVYASPSKQTKLDELLKNRNPANPDDKKFQIELKSVLKELASNAANKRARPERALVQSNDDPADLTFRAMRINNDEGGTTTLVGSNDKDKRLDLLEEISLTTK